MSKTISLLNNIRDRSYYMKLNAFHLANYQRQSNFTAKKGRSAKKS